MRKILSLTLVLTILLGAFCIFPASAAVLKYDESKTIGFLGYDDGTATIYSYTNEAATSVTIPEKIEGYTVTEIDEDAFINCKKLTEITLPDTITRIGKSAFYETPLKKINLPANLQIIDDYAFLGCSNLSKVVLPETLTYIGTSAFLDCTGVEFNEITIPDSVTHIGSFAFYGCTHLEKINMSGENLTYLGTNIAYETAYYENSENWENDALYCGAALFDTQVYGYTSYTVKEGTRIIAEYAFNHNYDNIKNLVLPNSVKYIGKYCFWGCTGFENVKLSKNLETIPEGAFSGCSHLRTIIIPEGVTSIDHFAFYNCKSLTHIVIPQSVNYLGEKSIGYNEDMAIIDGALDYGDEYKSENLVIAGYPNTVAESYANEHGFEFVNLTEEYKDEVLKLLNIPEDDPGTGGGWLAYYNELYRYPAPSYDGTTPDYVLIEVYENVVGPAFAAELLGDFVLRSYEYKYPATFGYVIYLPETNEIYSLEKAYELNIEGIENVFTEGGIGELLGDVNYDRELNIKDATLIQKSLVGLAEIENDIINGFVWIDEENVPTCISDFNCDRKSDIRDVTAIQKAIAGF